MSAILAFDKAKKIISDVVMFLAHPQLHAEIALRLMRSSWQQELSLSSLSIGNGSPAISFFSKKLNSAERNYSVRRFQHFVELKDGFFYINTDHKLPT